MKSKEVGTTLKHPETINGSVKNLSKRMNITINYRAGEMEGVGTSLNRISKEK